MRTEVVGASPEAIARAALLSAGEIVAFPTETVYGLGADARNPAAVARIYQAKGRPATNPLIVHVLGWTEALSLVTGPAARAERLAAAFWPGPLTLVLPRSGSVPPIVTAGGDTVAVRAPSHPVARALLAAFGGPIAAPSANRSSAISPTRAEHVAAELDGRVPLILDGGPCEVGLESTVVSLIGAATVLRPGAITPSAIARVIGEGVGWVSTAAGGIGPLPSPGMLERHYSPGRPLRVIDAWGSPAGLRVAAIARGDEPLPDGFAAVRRLPEELTGFGRELYDALRWADGEAVDEIWIRRPPDGEAWAAVRDRLERASRH